MMTATTERGYNDEAINNRADGRPPFARVHGAPRVCAHANVLHQIYALRSLVILFLNSTSKKLIFKGFGCVYSIQ